MEKTLMVTRKKVAGQVEVNDGQLAEIQTVGIEGDEKNLLLDRIQIHREDSDDTPQEFCHRFPKGLWLDILTITEITAWPTEGTR